MEEYIINLQVKSRRERDIIFIHSISGNTLYPIKVVYYRGTSIGSHGNGKRKDLRTMIKVGIIEQPVMQRRVRKNITGT